MALMFLRGREGNELELSVVGYQFPDEERDPWDSNCLLVSVRVLAPQGSWAVVDPCLTTWEAKRLVAWLVHAAGREPGGRAHDLRGAQPDHNGPDPGRPAALRVNVRACFSLELRPPWLHDVAGSDNLCIDLDVERAELARAAAALLSDLLGSLNGAPTPPSDPTGDGFRGQNPRDCHQVGGNRPTSAAGETPATPAGRTAPAGRPRPARSGPRP